MRLRLVLLACLLPAGALAGCFLDDPEEPQESSEAPQESTEAPDDPDGEPVGTAPSPTPATPGPTPATPGPSPTPATPGPGPTPTTPTPSPAAPTPATPTPTAPLPATPAPATPTPATPGPEPPATWPREGSYAVYQVETSRGAPDGSYARWTETNVTMRYQDGRWEADCEGWLYERNRHLDPPQDMRQERVLRKGAFDPPALPPDAPMGALVEPRIVVGSCQAIPINDPMTLRGTADVDANQSGAPVKAPAWTADHDDGCCSFGSTAWSRSAGLVLAWHWGGRGAHQVGTLLDTDAPIAPGSARPAPPAPAWPIEGSFVSYRLDDRHAFESLNSVTHMHLNLTLRYESGAWRGTCVFRDVSERDGETSETPGAREVSFPPFRGPLRIAPGEEVLVQALRGCDPAAENATLAQAVVTEPATRQGAALDVDAWRADERPGERNVDQWWDTATGLLLLWETTDEHGVTQGRLTDTDAPLG